MNRQTAIKYRRRIEQAAVSLPDEDALDAPEMYPHWREIPDADVPEPEPEPEVNTNGD